MKKLFIIGNGFDLSHNLKTTYEDFHQYLIAKYPDSNSDDFIVPEYSMMPDGSDYYDNNEVVSYLLRLISSAEKDGEKWSDLENSLGYLEYDEYFDDIEELLDEEGDCDLWGNMYNNEDCARNLVEPTRRITQFFSDWVNTININKRTFKKAEFEALINKDNDLFLSFNYTRTLELLYEVKKICHIHGQQGESLLFGHGNDIDYYDDNMSKYTGAESSLQQIQAVLRKDTNGAINRHLDFFNNISSDVDKIYTYGFSFSEVDQIYIKEICNRLETKEVIWYLNDFDDCNQLEDYKKLIQLCGFEGKFSTYHVS